MPGYSEQLAQWCAGLQFSDLPADVVASTKLRVLDVIGLALAAVPLATGKSVRAAALAMGTAPTRAFSAPAIACPRCRPRWRTAPWRRRSNTTTRTTKR
jgi:2-methylcitrate dehydratase PrpD